MRGAALALALLAALACAAPSPPPAIDPMARQEELLAALARYSDLILRMDSAALAGTFVADGETVDGDRPPIRGPKAIQAFLDTFSGYQVLENRMHAEETRIQGKGGRMTGTFWQRVKLPDGAAVTADWVEVRPGSWKLRRMATVAKPPA